MANTKKAGITEQMWIEWEEVCQKFRSLSGSNKTQPAHEDSEHQLKNGRKKGK